MKKFSLKFMVVFILVLFTSFIYADGVFSRYYNDKFPFSIDVPITKYEQDTPDDKGTIVNLDFIKNSKFIPTKNFFKGYRGLSGDLLSIESKNKDIAISAYGTYFLNSEEANGLEDIENIKDLNEIGLYGAITGKAIYAETLSLEEAIKAVRN